MRQVTTENTDQTSESITDEQATGTSLEEVVEETSTEETQSDGDKPEGDELPPEVLRKKLTEANAEAANYRTRLREAEQKLSEAKTPEEYEAAVKDLVEKNAALERSVLVATVAREYDLPSELAELLKGDDEDALKKHAKTLQQFVAPKGDPESLDGGLTPGSGEEFDPVAEARKARARRY
jgi:hypothetical protein